MPKAKSKSTGSGALKTSKVTGAAAILQRSVCLLLQCEKLGNSRKVNVKDVEISKDEQKLEGEKKSLRITKQLVDTKEMRPCRAIISAAKDYLRSIAVPGHDIFGAGTYLVPIGHVKEAEERLSQFQKDLKERVEELVARWEDVVDGQRKKLGPLFDEKQYASADEVRSAFDLDWSYVSFAAPERLLDVDKGVAEAAQKKYEAKLDAAYNEVVVSLRTSALTVMKELASKLSPNKDGDPKALQPTALRDLQEFLGRLPVLNISDDGDLLDICAKVNGIAKNIDVDVIRKAPGVRDMLLEAANEAVKDLDSLLTTGRRAISFGSLSAGKKKAS